MSLTSGWEDAVEERTGSQNTCLKRNSLPPRIRGTVPIRGLTRASPDHSHGPGIFFACPKGSIPGSKWREMCAGDPGQSFPGGTATGNVCRVRGWDVSRLPCAGIPMAILFAGYIADQGQGTAYSASRPSRSPCPCTASGAPHRLWFRSHGSGSSPGGELPLFLQKILFFVCDKAEYRAVSNITLNFVIAVAII